jgi:hypothetical protein
MFSVEITPALRLGLPLTKVKYVGLQVFAGTVEAVMSFGEKQALVGLDTTPSKKI